MFSGGDNTIDKNGKLFQVLGTDNGKAPAKTVEETKPAAIEAKPAEIPAAPPPQLPDASSYRNPIARLFGEAYEVFLGVRAAASEMLRSKASPSRAAPAGISSHMPPAEVARIQADLANTVEMSRSAIESADDRVIRTAADAMGIGDRRRPAVVKMAVEAIRNSHPYFAIREHLAGVEGHIADSDSVADDVRDDLKPYNTEIVLTIDRISGFIDKAASETKDESDELVLNSFYQRAWIAKAALGDGISEGIARGIIIEMASRGTADMFKRFHGEVLGALPFWAQKREELEAHLKNPQRVIDANAGTPGFAQAMALYERAHGEHLKSSPSPLAFVKFLLQVVGVDVDESGKIKPTSLEWLLMRQDALRPIADQLGGGKWMWQLTDDMVRMLAGTAVPVVPGGGGCASSGSTEGGTKTGAKPPGGSTASSAKGARHSTVGGQAADLGGYRRSTTLLTPARHAANPLAPIAVVAPGAAAVMKAGGVILVAPATAAGAMTVK